MQFIAGIDIAKGHLDACTDGKTVRRFDANVTGRQQLIEHLLASGISIVIFEASGGLERALQLDLQRAQLECRCINPRRIRQYAQSTGQLAKTDALDAKVIRSYGVSINPPAREEISERKIQLLELLSRRDQLMQMRTMEMNRRQQCMDETVQASIEQCLELLNAEVERVEQKLEELIGEHKVQAGLSRVLKDVKGVGPQTANRLIIRVPELGRVSRGPIAALVGLAPMNNDSGSLRGKRTIKGGRGDVRRVLYMAAQVAVRHNPTLRDYYQGLRARGKTFKVAIVACMRKLLVHLNALARDYYDSLVEPC